MRQRGLVRRLECRVTLVDLVPVHHLPPRLQIFGTTIVVLEIVRVLPHVVAEYGIKPLADGIVLIWRADHLHFALAVACQPNPSAAELLRAGIVEFGLE